jgi:hypothetical protein
MKRPFLLIMITTAIVFLSPIVAYAASTTLKQKVLPLNCVFQEVNDGLGTLYYLTPEECGVVAQPPSNPGNTTGSNGQVYYRVPFVLPYNPNQSVVVPANSQSGLPWQPLVAVVQGNGRVSLVSQKSHTGSSKNFFSNIPLASFRPTSIQVVVGTSAGLLVMVVLVLAFL